MHLADSERRRPLLDVSQFWHARDRLLLQHRHFGNFTLSHNLYRKMPPRFNVHYALLTAGYIAYHLPVRSAPGIRVMDIGHSTGRWSKLMLSRGRKPYVIEMLRSSGSLPRNSLHLRHVTVKVCVSRRTDSPVRSITYILCKSEARTGKLWRAVSNGAGAACSPAQTFAQFTIYHKDQVRVFEIV